MGGATGPVPLRPATGSLRRQRRLLAGLKVSLALLGASHAPAAAALCFEPQEVRADTMLPARLCFTAETMVSVDGKTCEVAGRRQITTRRDYLDLSCPPGGERLDLDINALPGGLLLINRRPLGSATLYRPS